MRSLLFVPAHDERKLAKGLASGADALIVDLEDAVPPDAKLRAREVCADFVTAHAHEARLIVRINALDTGLLLGDLAAVVRAKPWAVMLPKSVGGADVTRVANYLAALETRDGLAEGHVGILPIATESAQAVLGVQSYGPPADARLCGLMWGGEDLAADVGTLANRDASKAYTAPYMLARSLTLLGAASARVAAIDAVYTDFRDPQGLRAECADAVRDGFVAKAAIHPDQVAIINAAFTPSEAQVDGARRVIAAFAAAPDRGAIAFEGRMLDRPHLRAAERLLSRTRSPIANTPKEHDVSH